MLLLLPPLHGVIEKPKTDHGRNAEHAKNHEAAEFDRVRERSEPPIQAHNEQGHGQEQKGRLKIEDRLMHGRSVAPALVNKV